MTARPSERLSYLAPMEGITSNPGFLYLCKKHGCDVLVLPMVFLEHLSSDPGSIDVFLRFLEDNDAGIDFGPVILQLAGSDASCIDRVLDFLSSHDLAGINLNLGCPSSRLARKPAGAYLLHAPAIRDGLVAALASRSPFPFSVKIRLLGRSIPDVDATVEFCRSLDQHGLEFVAIHGRTLHQGYRGVADWDTIRLVHDSIDTPVIGNGDLLSAADGERAVAAGYCNAYMIGRAAMHDPRVFSPHQSPLEKDRGDLVSLFREYLDFFDKIHDPWKDRYLTLHELRRWLILFSGGIPGSRNFRARLSGCRTLDDLLAAVDTLEPRR